MGQVPAAGASAEAVKTPSFLPIRSAPLPVLAGLRRLGCSPLSEGSTLLMSLVRLARTDRPWQRQQLLDFSGLVVSPAKPIQEELQPVCVFLLLWTRVTQQIMSLLLLLASWNTVLLPVEFRTDH